VNLEPIPLTANKLISACVKHKGIIAELSEGQKLSFGVLLWLSYTIGRGSDAPEEEFFTLVQTCLAGPDAFKQSLLAEVEAFLARNHSRMHGVLYTMAKAFEQEGQIVVPWRPNNAGT